MAAASYLKLDPAIERWNRMREDVYKHFRFTRRTTLISLTGFVLVPGTIYYLASQTHASTLTYTKLSLLTTLTFHTAQVQVDGKAER
ncbi:hypothetical protein BS17DRAFT_813908 [Gyrodon lividus]|nr:hypothetical protein BS17DRAFT_813908 [Gyrodon lividus]